MMRFGSICEMDLRDEIAEEREGDVKRQGIGDEFGGWAFEWFMEILSGLFFEGFARASGM